MAGRYDALNSAMTAGLHRRWSERAVQLAEPRPAERALDSLGMRSWWVPVPASLLVGLCFALPLFLLLRERAVRKRPTRRKDTGMNRALPKATP